MSEPPESPRSAEPAAPAAFTVGFDLDMTLIDSRPGIRATYVALAAETGVDLDPDVPISRLGPPVEEELAHWFPAEQVPKAAERYRALYPAHAIAGTRALPGAREAIEAVHRAGGRVLVVTAKHEPNARLHLRHLGLAADALAGSLWAEGKAAALRAHGARVYVGDHLGDVRGAAAAGALSVAVATGPCGERELRQAGADVVLPDLTAFPAWLAGCLAAGGADLAATAAD